MPCQPGYPGFSPIPEPNDNSLSELTLFSAFLYCYFLVTLSYQWKGVLFHLTTVKKMTRLHTHGITRIAVHLGHR